jgi:hypothetical protein
VKRKCDLLFERPIKARNLEQKTHETLNFGQLIYLVPGCGLNAAMTGWIQAHIMETAPTAA